ncbi:hypothetical protein AVEN_214899-1, partial [Araneus ventricosus]
RERFRSDDPTPGPAIIRLLADDGRSGNLADQLLHDEPQLCLHFHTDAQR